MTGEAKTPDDSHPLQSSWTQKLGLAIAAADVIKPFVTIAEAFEHPGQWAVEHVVSVVGLSHSVAEQSSGRFTDIEKINVLYDEVDWAKDVGETAELLFVPEVAPLVIGYAGIKLILSTTVLAEDIAKPAQHSTQTSETGSFAEKLGSENTEVLACISPATNSFSTWSTPVTFTPSPETTTAPVVQAEAGTSSLDRSDLSMAPWFFGVAEGEQKDSETRVSPAPVSAACAPSGFYNDNNIVDQQAAQEGGGTESPSGSQPKDGYDHAITPDPHFTPHVETAGNSPIPPSAYQGGDGHTPVSSDDSQSSDLNQSSSGASNGFGQDSTGDLKASLGSQMQTGYNTSSELIPGPTARGEIAGNSPIPSGTYLGGDGHAAGRSDDAQNTGSSLVDSGDSRAHVQDNFGYLEPPAGTQADGGYVPSGGPSQLHTADISTAANSLAPGSDAFAPSGDLNDNNILDQQANQDGAAGAQFQHEPDDGYAPSGGMSPSQLNTAGISSPAASPAAAGSNAFAPSGGYNVNNIVDQQATNDGAAGAPFLNQMETPYAPNSGMSPSQLNAAGLQAITANDSNLYSSADFSSPAGLAGSSPASSASFQQQDEAASSFQAGTNATAIGQETQDTAFALNNRMTSTQYSPAGLGTGANPASLHTNDAANAGLTAISGDASHVNAPPAIAPVQNDAVLPDANNTSAAGKDSVGHPNELAPSGGMTPNQLNAAGINNEPAVATAQANIDATSGLAAIAAGSSLSEAKSASLPAGSIVESHSGASLSNSDLIGPSDGTTSIGSDVANDAGAAPSDGGAASADDDGGGAAAAADLPPAAAE